MSIDDGKNLITLLAGDLYVKIGKHIFIGEARKVRWAVFAFLLYKIIALFFITLIIHFVAEKTSINPSTLFQAFSRI